MNQLNIADIDSIVNDIRKEFGEQSVFRLGADEKLADIKVRSTGSLMLDLAIGGGYPQGRLVELSGVESGGKTLLVNLAIAEAQIAEPEKLCCIVDLEQSYNPEWAAKLGVDTERLLISQPDTYAEKVYSFIESLLETGKFSIICIDSIAGLVTREELEEEDWAKESRIGGTSKINSKAMRKLVNSGLLTKSGTTLIFINQLRDKIGGFSMYGTPTTTTTGGRSINHAYSQRLEVSKGEQFSKGTGDSRVVLGQQIKVKCSKNKIAPPHRTASIDLYYETGVDRIVELVNVAKAINVLSGTNWLKFQNPLTGEVFSDNAGNDIRFNGTAKTVEALKEDIANGGELYTKMFNTVNEVIRG